MSRVGRRAGAVALVAIAALSALAWYDRPPVTPGAWLQASGLAPRFANVSAGRVRYVRAGSGSAVVLVHGFGSSLYTWKDVIPALAARHDVIAFDLPGFGGSERPAGLSFEDLPRAVLELMNELGLERAALVGSSLGGATAVLASAWGQERVSRLVLLDAAGFEIEPSARPVMVRLATSRLGPALQRLPGKRLLVEHALRQVLEDDRLVTAERVSEYLEPLQRAGSLAALHSLGASLERARPRFAEALRAIQAPTLVIWGEQDQWIPLAHADRFVAAIPGARRVALPACGHLPQEEKPGEVARLLVEFLE